MSKAQNKNGLFVDTGYLRDHVYQLRQQKHLAARLYESVAAMKQQSDPSVHYQYTSILRDIDQLVEYFNRMARLLTEIDDDAVQLSKELGMLIEDGTENIRSTTSRTFML